jgi:hypothetical protein
MTAFALGRRAVPLTAVLFLSTTHDAYAQGDTNPIVASSVSELRPEYYLVAAFGLLGLIIISLEFILFLRARERVSANDIVRAFSTTLILIGVVALLGIGYNEKQVQPALGLFGTLLGYLMGRGEGEARSAVRPKPADTMGSRES